MEYLLGAGRGKVFLKGDAVFDARCRRLRRSSLIEGGRSEMNTLREIVLSGAGKVECLSSPGTRQEEFLAPLLRGQGCLFMMRAPAKNCGRRSSKNLRAAALFR